MLRFRTPNILEERLATFQGDPSIELAHQLRLNQAILVGRTWSDRTSPGKKCRGAHGRPMGPVIPNRHKSSSPTQVVQYDTLGEQNFFGRMASAGAVPQFHSQFRSSCEPMKNKKNPCSNDPRRCRWRLPSDRRTPPPPRSSGLPVCPRLAGALWSGSPQGLFQGLSQPQAVRGQSRAGQGWGWNWSLQGRKEIWRGMRGFFYKSKRPVQPSNRT